MKITVLFDEETCLDNLYGAFGLSLLIGNNILFDTGSDGSVLVKNLQALNIPLEDITSIVLSHEHWDHIDGLREIVPLLSKPNIYVSKSFPLKISKEISEYGGIIRRIHLPVVVEKNVYITNEMNGLYKNEFLPEQSIIILTSQNTATLICGCAHFGIENKIEKINLDISVHLDRKIKINTVIGGLHLSKETDGTLTSIVDTLLKTGITKIGSLHCSGKCLKSLLKIKYPENLIDIKVGSVFDV